MVGHSEGPPCFMSPRVDATPRQDLGGPFLMNLKASLGGSPTLFLSTLGLIP